MCLKSIEEKKLRQSWTDTRAVVVCTDCADVPDKGASESKSKSIIRFTG